MKTLEYKICTPVGIHARNALFLSREAAQFQSDIYIRKEDHTVNAKNVMAIMTMRIKCGDTISFLIKGNDEEIAQMKLQEFCEGNL